jgi:hypothetical protein
MAPVNGYVYNMHKVPTYAEIIEEAIIHPVDKIKLPDRQALFLRNLPQMTRFDEVDDPADIGKEQERMQQTKLQELTIKQLAPGETQSIARVRDEQSRPQEEYTPSGGGPLQGPQPQETGRLRRGAAAVGNYYASVWKRMNEQHHPIEDPYYIAHDGEPAKGPFAWMSSDTNDLYTASRNLQAQEEQAAHNQILDAMNRAHTSMRQSQDAMNTPDSTAHHFIGEDDSPPSGGASSSSGTGWFSNNIEHPTYRKPPPGGGGGSGGHRGPGFNTQNAVSSLINTFTL